MSEVTNIVEGVEGEAAQLEAGVVKIEETSKTDVAAVESGIGRWVPSEHWVIAEYHTLMGQLHGWVSRAESLAHDDAQKLVVKLKAIL